MYERIIHHGRLRIYPRNANLVQHSKIILYNSSHQIHKEKYKLGIEGIFLTFAYQLERKKWELSLFADDMVIYVENPKESTKNSWNYGSRIKVNIQKSITFRVFQQ